MGGGRYLKVTIIFIILGLLYGSFFAYGQIEGDLELKVLDAYKAIDNADHNGGNVSELVDLFNQVIEDSKSGVINTNEAMIKLDSIIEEAKKIEQEGIEAQSLEIGLVALNSIIVIGLCLIIWKYFPRLYWHIWLRYRGHWMIK